MLHIFYTLNNQNTFTHLAPIMALVAAFAACLAGEVFCFSIIALAVYKLSTQRIGNYRTENIQKLISIMLDFISNGKDKRLRVISITKALKKADFDLVSTDILCDYVDKVMDNDGFEGVKQISYKEIRQKSYNRRNAALFPYVWEKIKEQHTELIDDIYSIWSNTFGAIVRYLTFLSLMFVFGPILLLSKIIQIFFPWIIVGYLIYNDLLFSNKIEIFQLVMLAVYIGLQLILVILGIKVFRTHWWLWHVNCGVMCTDWKRVKAEKLEQEIHIFYDDVYWYLAVERILFDSLGQDIGAMIIMYCKSIYFEVRV